MPTAVITGASSGFGEALTRKLLSRESKEIWSVIMIARNEQNMEKIAKECCDLNQNINYKENIKIIGCDLSIPIKVENECIPSIISWINYKHGINNEWIDLLINNAGGTGDITKSGDIESCDLETWKYVQDLNVTSPFLLIKYLLKYIDKSSNDNYKSIINIGSISGTAVDESVMIYSIAKAALHHLNKCAALLAAKKYSNIRVNCIAMCGIRTGIHQRILGQKAGDDWLNDFKSITPMKRNGTINDVIQMILFFMDSNKSGWITGQVMVMDGGLSLPVRQKSKL